MSHAPPSSVAIDRLKDFSTSWRDGKNVSPTHRTTEGLRIRGLIEMRYVRGVDVATTPRAVGAWFARLTPAGEAMLAQMKEGA